MTWDLPSDEAREFLTHCRYEKALNPKTIKAYAIDLRQFHQFLELMNFRKSVKRVDKRLARAFVQHLNEAYEPRSIKRKIASVKAFFNFLEAEEKIKLSPFHGLRLRFNVPKSLPHIIPPDQIRLLLRGLYRRKKSFRKSERDSFAYFTLTRDLAVIELLYATGIRVTELSHLLPTDVDLTAATIYVRGKGNRDRLLPIAQADTLKLLKEHSAVQSACAPDCDFFFANRLGKRFSEQSIRFMLRKYANDLNLPLPIKPHMFRHTLATSLLENGVDTRFIQSILGHSSILTTQIYTSVSAAHQRRVLGKKHPRVKLMG